MKKVPSIKPQVPSPKKSALGRFPWNLGLGIWNLGLKHFGKLSCFGIIPITGLLLKALQRGMGLLIQIHIMDLGVAQPVQELLHGK
jgi:hypothetical protein